VRRWGGPQVPWPLNPLWLAAQFAIETPGHYAMVGIDDEPLGLFGLRLHPRQRRAHLIRVALAPEARGLGLAGPMLRGAAQLARESRIQRLTLNVYGSNDEARQAYERAGFFVHEYAKATEDPTGVMLRMLKPL
jgi:ribosomal protein S18 acetylase RimI-like enzyme